MALDYLILYEHTVREYESILLLQLELERRGYTVEIRQLLDRKKLKYFTWKKPKVLVASCLYDNEGLNSHVYNNVGRLDKVVNLHWEQMLSDTQEEEPWFNFCGNAKKCVQTCWGEATAERLVAHDVPKRNAPVTGAMLMDFLRPEFGGYYKDKEALCRQYGLDPARPLWLYISSFGYASMGEDEVKELSQMAGTDFTEFAKVNRTSMAETLRWFEQALTAHPEAQLVYRRHPSEWNSPALDALAKKCPNFHVIYEEGVKQWIVAADAIFIWMSTAIAEVYFSGKSCHILRPEAIPHEFDPVIYKGGQYIGSCGEFQRVAGEAAAGFPAGTGRGQAAPFDAVSAGPVSAAGEAAMRDPSRQDLAFPIAPALIERYFDVSDQPAYKRMANLLEEVYKTPPRDHPFSEGYTPHFNWLKCFALIGVHMMFALRLNPAHFKKVAPGFAAFAGRIYGYVEKAHVPKKQAQAMRQHIARFIK